ncbi:MAG: xanthine dehydrogenase molybdopterin binding subunit, partial [Betaproteobacteria bacterium]
MNKPAELPLQAAPEVGRSRPHESAALHVAGRAHYTDDIPEPTGTLHAALGLSPVPHGVIESLDLARVRAMPGVVGVFSAADIPGVNDCGPLVHDDPILAGTAADSGPAGPVGATLRYRGQPVFVVVARSRDEARRAAALAPQVIRARRLPALLTPEEAHAAGQYVVPPMHLGRGDAAAAIAAAPRRLRTRFSVGGQAQFYRGGPMSRGGAAAGPGGSGG